MKITEILAEHKKGVKAVKYTSKPRDPNTKTMQGIRSSGASGAHKDKKKAAKQGNVKHKKQDVALEEKWTQKYKSSINCSHPKGFSQKAHCAGKNKHNEDTSMEMVCEDCGMCQTHGNLNEIKKGAKDSNGFTKCWPGKHAEGTKKGKDGGQVRNCVPNESINETRNPDLMSPSDYDRYQQGQMDQEKRNFKRQEMDQELGDEDRGMYWVVIAKNGKWEHTKAQPRQEGMNAAQNIINALHAKYPSMHLGMMGPDGKVYNMGKGR